jgi:hypothetical protein
MEDRMRSIYILLAFMILIGSCQGAAITSALNFTATTSQVEPFVSFFVGNSSCNQTGTVPDGATTNFKGSTYKFRVAVDPGTNYFRINATGGDHIGGNDYYYTTDFPASAVIYCNGASYDIEAIVGTWIAAAA